MSADDPKRAQRAGPATAPAVSFGASPSARCEETLLRIRDLHAGYGASEVLFGIDLAVGAGQIVGVLGRNGMGKTTLVRSIMGLLRPSRGEIVFDGASIGGLAPNRIARCGIAIVPEGRQVFPNLDVLEHLTAFQRAGPGERIAAWTPARALALFPRLGERRRHMGTQLSGGEQQMLAIARALVTNPRLLILDEATEGLAPLVREEIWRALGELRREGHAMIVIDKYVERLISIADRHAILEKGRIVWRGSSAELDADRAAWHRHLGV
jgi:branched-chain amino acid transport system ATP-binding protein